MDDQTGTDVENRLVAKVVGAYLRHHVLAANEISGLIATVHRALSGLGQSETAVEARTPAVSVRRSVRPDHVVCLECGYRGKVLRRHLTQRHGLDPAAYRARWNLASDHPITAPGYSQMRSAQAKARGLGSPGRKASGHPPPADRALDPAFVASLSKRRPSRGRRSSAKS
jgi:predicted transcriptional regulator